MRAAGRKRLLLAGLALVAAVIQLRVSVDVIHTTIHRADRARAPFRLRFADGTLVDLREEARTAGLADGDYLVEVGGKDFDGTADLARAVRGAEAGATIDVAVERGGERIAASVRLAHDAVAGMPGAMASLWALRFLMPWFSLAIGFWAAFVRPDDRRAWLLLFLMATFTDPFGRGLYAHWEPGLRELGQLWGSLASTTWPLAMMTFGVWFPERLRLDARFPWPRRIASAVLAAHALLRSVAAFLAPWALPAAFVPARWLDAASAPLFFVGMAAVGSYFFGQGMRHGEDLGPDARRRLILSQAGTTVAMLPAFVLVIVSLVTGRDFDRVAPPWVLFPGFGLVLLFPLTLAYVVVVERALDVRLVIRQGLRHALERRGIFVLRVALIAATAAWTLWSVTRPETRRVEVVGAMATGALLIVLLKRFGDATLRWTDRRFFREAVNAERVLETLADEVRTVTDRSAIVDTVARRLTESLHVERLAVLLRDGEEFVSPDLRLAASAPLVDRIARALEPVRVQPGQSPELDRFGAEVIVPLAARDHLPGFVVLGARKAEAPYSAADLKLLRAAGMQVGLALENARLTAAVAAEAAQRGRLTREVEIAREVQQRLFPQRIPEILGLDLAGYCRTALGVGGDYYDFLVLPDGDLLLAIGDVSGKGIGAALVMASLQASLRGQSFRASGDLARLLSTVNLLVHDATPENRYATLFVGRYEPAARRLVYVNAGHNPPMLLRAGRGREVVRLKATGMVVGLMDSAAYHEAEVTLDQGDLLCGFSDGISEAMTEDDREFGEERLLDTLHSARDVPLGEVIRRIFEAADAFTAGAPQYDDMTVILARTG